MLKTLKINNFRCFSEFEISKLGQINLLVGKNNTGKTSILEAIKILSSEPSIDCIEEVMLNRGEYLISEDSKNNRELDICHLFNGHEIDVGSHFSVSGTGENFSRESKVFIREESSDDSDYNTQEWVFEISWSGFENSGLENKELKVPLSSRNSLIKNSLLRQRMFSRIPRDLKGLGVTTQLIRTSSLNSRDMIELFEAVVLTREEQLLIEALQTIEPSIERLASISSRRLVSRMGPSREGFLVKLSNLEQRVPIGSLGDGIWRMLGLTLAIANAKDGILLVDEIDTGLHFTTMSDMWRLIWDAAKRLNVQVFATTHNSDCWQSLAAIADSEHPSSEGITIQRIEKDKPQSVLFTERQVAIAVERGIEVR
jgi:AAA15 family ATPase/GTPase